MSAPTCKFGWYELMTSDVSGARAFYESVIGWTSHDASGGAGQYFSFNAPSMPEAGVAGLMALPEQAGSLPGWMGYIDVPNVDEYVDKVISAGGALHRGPADVPGMLRFAVFTDPHGAPFILFTPDPAMPANPARPEPPAIGTIGWNELSAGDMKADFDFYASLFGWTVAADMDMGPMGIYRVFNYAGSTSPMGDGGMASLPPNFPSPFWTFYFNVDSTTAAMERITAGGGKVLHGPHQVPGGGWIAQAFDPQGAFFSIVSSEK